MTEQPKKPPRDSACAVYEIRYNEDTFESENELKEVLSKWAKHWTFQLEMGDSGYRHYQGRISLHKKRRLPELKKIWTEYLPNFIVQTVNPEFIKCGYDLNGIFYSLKEDTRIKGPWHDQEIVKYIPRQVRETPNLRPWQAAIIADADVWNTRIINIIYDVTGNIGKSTLASHCRVHGHARVLPPVKDAEKLLRMVCDMPTSKMYMFDMPRAMKKEHMNEFYTGVETIKDGYAYDDRYTFREKHFDCPNIWIFTNRLPDMDYMSEDRWKIWTIEENELCPYEEPLLIG